MFRFLILIEKFFVFPPLLKIPLPPRIDPSQLLIFATHKQFSTLQALIIHLPSLYLLIPYLLICYLLSPYLFISHF
jgi:hypothetical protein